MKKINIYTDGSCQGNPGPGGWGAILRYQDKEKEISGGETSTTNNRMELLAVIESLRLLKEPCQVTIFSDSQYVCNTISKGWAKNWKKNGWKRSDKKLASNPDLCEDLLLQLDKHEVKIIWVKGHNGHPENERCDRLASLQAYKYAKQRVLIKKES